MAPGPLTGHGVALLEQLRSDAVGTEEAAVGANPDGHSEVRHFSPARLVDTDFRRRQRNQTRANPVVSPAKGALRSRDPLGHRLQDVLSPIVHGPLYAPLMAETLPACT